MIENTVGPQRLSLERIAMVSMEFGRLMMESGASARMIDEVTTQVARTLGADRVDMRVGYASLAITVGIGNDGITRMRRVGPMGVNQRLDHAVRDLAKRVQDEKLNYDQAQAELTKVAKTTPHHPGWLVCVAVGVACASFGRLLGIDWLAVGPTFTAATLGQAVRRKLHARHTNVFITATVVAFLASAFSGITAKLLNSTTVNMAMISAVLLLVPGVPCFNAQNDILEGRPTLGSARAVWVGFILIFLTVGVWLGQMLVLGEVK